MVDASFLILTIFISTITRIFLWLKDYPQNTKEKNRIEILLLLHDDYLYTIKEIPPR